MKIPTKPSKYRIVQVKTGKFKIQHFIGKRFYQEYFDGNWEDKEGDTGAPNYHYYRFFDNVEDAKKIYETLVINELKVYNLNIEKYNKVLKNEKDADKLIKDSKTIIKRIV